jgi:hypothetical protein
VAREAEGAAAAGGDVAGAAAAGTVAELAHAARESEQSARNARPAAAWLLVIRERLENITAA